MSDYGQQSTCYEESVVTRMKLWVAAATAGLVTLAGVTAGISSGAAAAGTGYSVTFVARQCPSYDSIMANRARNNIQESLRDLGPDSRYSPGQPVDPSVEEPAQPLCTPLNGRVFSFGNRIGGKVDHLTVVSGASPPTPATRASVPLLAADGSDTGRTIDGAVTVELSREQLALAQRGSSLWLQGGTPADPLPDPTVHGFGALRCAVDNLNGDNVEWIGYPNGYRHLFCYYLTVQIPPAPGTIRVVKKVTPDAGIVDERFPFTGNVSYNPGGTFQIGMTGGEPAGLDFVRGATRPGDDPWTVREDALPDWVLESLACTSRGGGSTVATDGAAASIRLVAGDLVTCTYTDAPVSQGIVLVQKITRGGTGGPFGFTVRPPTGSPTSFTASTTAEGEEVKAGSVKGRSGRYAVEETLPAPSGAGRWALTEAICNGVHTPIEGTTVDVDATAGDPATCTFTDTFTPAGELRLSKITSGGTGTFSYEIIPDPPLRLSEALNPRRSVTTTAQGVPVSAEPVRRLAMGRYLVTEFAPPVTGGAWTSKTIDCGDNHDVVLRNGQIDVELTAENPVADCRFANHRVPPLPPKPSPTVTPRPPVSPTPTASNEITIAPGIPPSTPPVSLGEGRSTRRGSALPFTGLGLIALLAVAAGAVGLGVVFLGPLRRHRRGSG